MPSLLKWATEFNIGSESWIPDGALQIQVLRRNPELRDSLHLRGFTPRCAVDALSAGKDAAFRFEYLAESINADMILLDEKSARRVAADRRPALNSPLTHDRPVGIVYGFILAAAH